MPASKMLSSAMTRRNVVVVPEPVQPAAQPITRMPASKMLSAAMTRHNVVVPEPDIPTVDPSVWGPPLWRILHVASVLSVTDMQKYALTTVLAALRTGIPCPECSGHYNNWYKSHPTQSVIQTHGEQHKLASKVFRIGSARTTIVTWVPLDRWILDLHNDVNHRRGVDQWAADRMNSTYGHVSLADVRAASVLLRGIIGNNASVAIDNLLNAIGA
jgi:hypothetical protein